MRAAFGLLLCIGLLPLPSRAWAQFPFASTATIGAGMGGARRDELGLLGAYWTLHADLSWRRRPGLAVVLSVETARGERISGHGIDSRTGMRTDLNVVEHRSLGLGIERSRDGAGIGPFLQGAVGVGRLTTDKTTSTGIALSAALGVRFVPAPGPVGFVTALRTQSLFTREATSLAFAITLGLAVRPL